MIKEILDTYIRPYSSEVEMRNILTKLFEISANPTDGGLFHALIDMILASIDHEDHYAAFVNVVAILTGIEAGDADVLTELAELKSAQQK